MMLIEANTNHAGHRSYKMDQLDMKNEHSASSWSHKPTLHDSSQSPFGTNDPYSNRNYIVIDCRYPYEFEGGHLKGAINIFNPKMLEQFITKHSDLLYSHEVVKSMKDSGNLDNANYKSLYRKYFCQKRKETPIIIFYCEFSSERAPNLYLLSRTLDTEMNNYPSLTFPNIFVMEGGYSEFVSTYPKSCSDGESYVRMDDPMFHKLKYENMACCSKMWRESGRKKLGLF